MPFLFQPNRAYVSRTGYTVIINRCPQGSTMSLTVVRQENGRLLRPPRVYTGAPKHERTTRYGPFFHDTDLTPEQILSLDIHHTKYIYEDPHQGIAGLLLPVMPGADAINGRRHCVLIKWTRV